MGTLSEKNGIMQEFVILASNAYYVRRATFTMTGAAKFLLWFDWIAFSKVTKKEVITHRALAHVEMLSLIHISEPTRPY